MTCFDSILILYASLTLDPLFITSFYSQMPQNLSPYTTVLYMYYIQYYTQKMSNNTAVNLDELRYWLIGFNSESI